MTRTAWVVVAVLAAMMGFVIVQPRAGLILAVVVATLTLIGASARRRRAQSHSTPAEETASEAERPE